MSWSWRWVAAGLTALMVLLGEAGRAPAQSYFDDIGYTDLQARLGAATPTGAGVPVAQIEALVAANTYLPDPASFPGKTITDRSGGGEVSGHATEVGTFFYGNSTQSIASGITQINAYRIDGTLPDGTISPNDWLGDAYLRVGQALPPRSDGNRVQNHSYIGDDPNAVEILRRLDLVVRRDNVVVVVGVNNGAGSIPVLQANAYNAIAVGLTNGNSSAGPSTAEGTGRSKPDIVAPLGVTSDATPVVSAASALLVQVAASKSDPDEAARAGRVETIKAALLSGATKSQFANLAQPWQRINNGSFVEPLDRRFGAGQLNINNSYSILSAPRQHGDDQVRDLPTGWDFDTLTAVGDKRRYYFDAPTNATNIKIAATINWLRRITQTGTMFTATLSTLELRLFETDASLNLGALVDSSLSPIDNVQHLYADAIPGHHYALEVNLAQLPVGQDSEDFAIAWQATFVPVPEPGGLALAGVLTVTLLVARRRGRRGIA